MRNSQRTWLTLVLTTSLMVSCSSDDKAKEGVANTETAKSSQPTQTKAATTKTYSAKDFFKTTTVFGSSINHDSTAVLVSNDATGVFNAYRYPLDGGEPTQLTESKTDTVYGVSWFPEDKPKPQQPSPEKAKEAEGSDKPKPKPPEPKLMEEPPQKKQASGLSSGGLSLEPMEVPEEPDEQQSSPS